MNRPPIFFPTIVVLSIVSLVTWAAHSPLTPPPVSAPSREVNDVSEVVGRADTWFHDRWNESHLTPSDRADELSILRRLSLSLCGTIPSLEEIRQFEADRAPDRVARWTDRLLADSRFADYFAERLARAFVGKEGGTFIIFRRDRFVDWLSEQLKINRPYDEMVREMIANDGLWTDHPSTNFITATLMDGQVDENKLAGRSVRAFLGQRIDCAQCHDHPFEHWKQQDFEGLAAYYGQTQLSLLGVRDNRQFKYEVEDRKTLEHRIVPPRVPFDPEWVPGSGTRREQLAAWITHPQNRRFERAVANRVWGLMFGRAWYEPVDDLPDPADPDLLDLLGGDFRAHGCDLRRLIHVIAATQVFQLSSAHPSEDPRKIEGLHAEWAVFPLVRLRPEQIIGSMFQASSIKTIDQNSHLVTRAIKFFQENKFIQDYGDLGENELETHSATVPQALLRMNGELANDRLKANPLNATSRIARLSSSPERCVETCFLASLSRRPTAEEREYFVSELAGAERSAQSRVVEDLVWSLFNSPEFSWNH